MPQSAEVLPGDGAGAETLEILAAAPRYNAWQFEMIAPFLGRRILEVGAGIGNMSEEFLKTSPELLVVTDTDDFYRRRLQERYAGRKEVLVEALTMPDPGAVAASHDLGEVGAVADHVRGEMRDDDETAGGKRLGQVDRRVHPLGW